ncbi:PTS sugar transporter subunit IIA [Trichococcus alkaliphilus]|uniref:PTS sugar transporter subunit IIA n=1 Tax=Trichococcus alkaliphilus TaxID=2052943 RepID=UPI000D0AD1DB|nr:PTS sugar transporter subunit IIA [Trichococcus alkaliphilus]
MITIKDEHILLDQTYSSAEAAIVAAGEFLVAQGLVSQPYIQSMLARHRKVSIYVGNFVALPHGDSDGQPYIDKEGICLIQVPDGVNFGSGKELQIATILFVVALKEKQLEALQDIAFFCSDIENVMALSDAKDLQTVQTILQNS